MILVKFFLVTNCILLQILLLAQKSPQYKGPIGYFEIGGNSSPTVSANVEHVLFAKEKLFINGHIGYGIGKVEGNQALAVPIGLNVFRGVKASHLELGLGLTYVKGYRFYYLGSEPVPSKAIYLAPNIAYRFQKLDGGVFLRITYAPLFRLREYTKPDLFSDIMKTHLNFGVALGYFFSDHNEVD